MAAQVLQFISGPDQRVDQRDFGGCPECHGNDGCLSDRKGDHYFICRCHGLKWKFGSRSFPAWEKMSPRSLIKQDAILALYRETEAWFPDVTITNDNGMKIEFTNPGKALYRWATHAAVSLADRCKLVLEPNDPYLCAPADRRTAKTEEARSDFEAMKAKATEVEFLKEQTSRLEALGYLLGGQVTTAFGRDSEEAF